MSDWIEHDGKKYLEAGCLIQANNNARRAKALVADLQAEIARLRALLPPECIAECGSRTLVSDGCVASMGKCDCGVAK